MYIFLHKTFKVTLGEYNTNKNKGCSLKITFQCSFILFGANGETDEPYNIKSKRWISAGSICSET
jgi:hypothetical protein